MCSLVACGFVYTVKTQHSAKNDALRIASAATLMLANFKLVNVISCQDQHLKSQKLWVADLKAANIHTKS